MKLFNRNKKKNKKNSTILTVDQNLSSRLTKEFKLATGRYSDAIKRSGIFRSSAIYGNPWFLLIGSEGCGKSSLLSGSGVNFPQRYPDEKDGDTLSGVQWQFGNKAVWIDLPGKLIESQNIDSFKATYQALIECRTKQPVDGIVCVVDIEDILNGDHDSVKKKANSIRAKIDELIVAWGFELPVFCIFSKIDKISGFYEFFNDTTVQWSEQILGATFTNEQQSNLPKKVFLEEHNLLCSSLKTLRLKRLSKEKNEENRRLICSFVIQFEGIQTKLSNFFAELFKESVFEGKPIFKGFFFSSCKSFELSGNKSNANDSLPADLSNTIVHHPLNPHRATALPETKDIVKKQIKSFFTGKLFDETLISGTQVLNRTYSSSRKESIRYWSIASCITALFVLCILYFVSSFLHIKDLQDYTKVEVTAALSTPKNGIDAFEQLERLGDLVNRYRQFNEHGVPLSYGLGFLKTKDNYSALKKIYFNRLWNLIVLPSVAYLEYGIKKYSSGYGELTIDNYNTLYRFLKSYLSMSEAVAHNSDRIDTVTIRETVELGLHQAILNREGNNRLPENIEIILKKNIHLYSVYLKNGDMPLIQENQKIIKDAQIRLSHLPDAKVLYESMRQRLCAAAPSLTLADILGGKQSDFLSSNKTISIIYTQEGWDRFVNEEISSVTKDPFKVDWVLGSTKESVKGQSYDQEQMIKEITTAYFEDVFGQWLDFLRSTKTAPMGDIVRTGMVLQKLSADGSELNLLLENILKLANINASPKGNEALNAVKKAAGKKFTKLEKQVQPLANIYKNEASAEMLKARFDPLIKFVRSEGRLGGLNAYHARMSILAEGLGKCSNQGNVLSVFSGKDDDPFLNAWILTQNIINEMPNEAGVALTTLLQTPLESIGAILRESITKELNDKWQVDVASVFTNSFSGKYPFVTSDNEAQFEEVMDFFRLNTGTFWGFFTRNLSPYIVKDVTSWKTRPVGNITLNIAEDFIESLNKADKITSIFFNTDGTLRVQKIAFLPLPQNKLQASLTLGLQEFKLLPDENRAQISWPVNGVSESITLRIFVNKNYTDEIKFNSMWGLIRLFDQSKVNTLNTSSFIANWERNVQNMFMVQYSCHVQIANAIHPFGNRVFSGFDCPMEIVKK